MHRRQFLAAAAASGAAPLLAAAEAAPPSPKVPLGLDGYSLRSMRWKAPELIAYAGEQKLDAVLLNGLQYFESLDAAYLRGLRDAADRDGLRVYLGSGSIAENGSQFSDKWGGAEEMVARAIGAATALGSPVVNVKIGSINDRFLEGGIGPRIDAAVAVLKACRSRALDAGVKFGFENHAADLRSEELIALVEEVGVDVCGVMIDPGNALWAMEDPLEHARRLAPHVVCNSLRDYTVWPGGEGALYQWMALGEGMLDVPAYVETLAGANPQMPMFVETISNSVRSIPYLTDEHWKGYPDLKASQIRAFLALVRRGEAATVAKPAEGQSRRDFEQEHQRGEFLRSIAYLREHCDAGRKPL